jgi:hypothetical protein
MSSSAQYTECPEFQSFNLSVCPHAPSPSHFSDGIILSSLLMQNYEDEETQLLTCNEANLNRGIFWHHDDILQYRNHRNYFDIQVEVPHLVLLLILFSFLVHLWRRTMIRCIIDSRICCYPSILKKVFFPPMLFKFIH